MRCILYDKSQSVLLYIREFLEYNGGKQTERDAFP